MLEGKVAFITGSTRGIGWATAQTFARHGATVIVNGRTREAVDERAREIRETFGTPALGLAGDAADPAAVKACYQAIFQEFQRLDVLVNNAGIMQDALIGMIGEAMVRRIFEVNTLGPICHLQEAARLMGRHGGGSIVNVSSIIGRVGNEGQAAYGASKAAILGLTFSAAKELAPKGIRVNAIAPGFIRTDMTRQLPPEKFAARAASIKMGRVGEPEDVANAILFLASELSAYVTGQVIGVDGGMLI